MSGHGNLQCYCSPRQTLSVHYEGGLRQWRCGRCGGRRILLDDFRRWRDSKGIDALTVRLPDQAAEYRETGGPRLCQQCGLIMSRYGVAQGVEFHVDRCAPCQSIWLDGLEWDILAAGDWLPVLDQIVSDPWQERLRAEATQARRVETMRKRFGEREFERLNGFANWLSSQPRRQEMLAVLTRAVSTNSVLRTSVADTAMDTERDATDV